MNTTSIEQTTVTPIALAETKVETDALVKPAISPYKHHVLLCTGPRCAENGPAQEIYDSLWGKLKSAGIHQGPTRTKFNSISCFAACKGGPVMCVQPDGAWYYNITHANMDRIIEEHLVGGAPVQELIFHQGPNAN